MVMNWSPVIAAGIAALVAVIGYLVNQAQARRDRKAREFADSLSAVCEYAQLPYSIVLQRLAIPVTTDSDESANGEAAARAEINKKMSDAWSHMHFSLAWLQVESHEVAERYEELVTKARKAEPELRQKAWEENLDNVQSETTLSGRYPFKDLDSWKACVVEMRVALQPTWRPLRRRQVRKQSMRQDFMPPFAPVSRN
jgi:hypothetical protein